MEFRLNISDLQDILFEHGSQFFDKKEGHYQENHFEFNHAHIQGRYTEIIMENAKISFGNGNLRPSTTLDFEFYGETIEMHFTLRGSSLTTIEGTIKDYLIGPNEHNLFYCKDIKGRLSWKSESMYVFEINLKPQFFESYLPDHGIFDVFKKHIQKGETGYMNARNYPIQSAMQALIQEMIHCNRTGLFKKIFLEAKIMELLLLQLEQIGANGRIVPVRPVQSDIDDMQRAKEVIRKNLDHPLSLHELAKELNTNECSLKKKFKEVVGYTVFGYIQDLKMQQAKEYILDHNLPIYQVADLVGYKNPQHFTVAFKKHFGFVPSTLRK